MRTEGTTPAARRARDGARRPVRRRHAAARSRVAAGLLSAAMFLGIGGGMAVRHASTTATASASGTAASSGSASSSSQSDSSSSGSTSWGATAGSSSNSNQSAVTTSQGS